MTGGRSGGRVLAGATKIIDTEQSWAITIATVQRMAQTLKLLSITDSQESVFPSILAPADVSG